MKIIQVTDSKTIKLFVDFPDKLYSEDRNYVPYMKGDLTKTLKRLLLIEKSYFALLAMDNKNVLGRVLCTIAHNKQLKTDSCGYFSLFECVHDQTVCDMMMGEATRRLKEMGATHLSGTYSPFDQDNRRGILVEGFDEPPLIFCSYNKTYYDKLLVNFGMAKQADTLSYSVNIDPTKYERTKRIAEYTRKKHNYRVDTVNWKQVDRDIEDFHTVMQMAAHDDIYQEAPDIETLRAIVKGWRRYLDKDYILIARSNETNEPLGIVMAMPDYFELFAKMKGKMNARGLWIFLTQRKKIKSVRAMLQYVVPAYQKTGMIASLYCKLWDGLIANNITRLEAGTMMEQNNAPNAVIKSVGGVVAHRYRIYYKEI